MTVMMTREKLVALLREAWDAGFDASGEGYNGEYLPESQQSSVEASRDHQVESIIQRQEYAENTTGVMQ